MPPIATEFTCHDKSSRSATSGLLHRSKNTSLFDNLVCERKHPIRHGQPERLGGVEIDHQVELGRLLNWKIGRFFSLKIRPTYTPIRR